MFTALDPLDNGNRYAWVQGNVVNRVDPSGMIDEVPPGDCNTNPIQQPSNPCPSDPSCGALNSPCDNWGVWKFMCETIEADQNMTNYGTKLAAAFVFGRLTEGLTLQFLSEEVMRTMWNYSGGKGQNLTYSAEWYNDHEYARWHKNTLYNWFINNYVNTSKAQGPVYAQIFVGTPTANDPGAQQAATSGLRFTFGRHYLRGCFTYNGNGVIDAQFVVKDRFDFDPTLCTPQVPLSALAGFGCIPHIWWVKAAAIGLFGGPFEQDIQWTEQVSVNTSFAPQIPSKPGCSTTQAGFCPDVNIISDLFYTP